MTNNTIPEGYKQSALGIIPSDWEVKYLSEIAQIKRGRFSPRPRNDPKFYGGEIPFIQTSDIALSNGHVSTFTQTLNEEGLKVSILFPKGTILMTIASNIGHCAILDIDMACPDSLVGIICKENSDNEFLNYYLRFVRAKLEYIAPGAQKNINIEFLNSLPIINPSLKEQRAIVKELDFINQSVSNTLKLIDQKELLKKWLMQQLLTSKKRLKGFQEDWTITQFDECFNFVKSYSISREGLTTNTIDEGIYCIHYGDIHSFYKNHFLDFSTQDRIPKFIDSNGVHQKDYLKDGDIIIADASEDYEGVGETIEVSNIDNKIAVGGLHTIILRGINNTTINGFRSYLFASSRVRNELRKKATGTSVYSITKSTLRSLSFFLPGLEEQAAITSVLKTADKEIQLLKAKAAKLKEVKKGIMQVLLTGKKRLKPIDI